MATVTIKATRCDVCRGDEAQTYFFQLPDGGKWEVDLCDKHAQPILSLLQYARSGRPRRNKRADGIIVSEPAPRPVAKKAPAKKRAR